MMLKTLVLCITLFLLPAAGLAGLCEENLSLVGLARKEPVASNYFDVYYIASNDKNYYIYASKLVPLRLATLVRVMDDHEAYPEFMPGYRAVLVERKVGGNLLTGIEFRPWFSPFVSRFTTEVQKIYEYREYRQCWLQLAPDDPGVLESFENAPSVNRGFWWLIDRGDGFVDMHYFSVIRPPLSLPDWLYKLIVKNSYQDVFEAMIKEAGAGSSK